MRVYRIYMVVSFNCGNAVPYTSGMDSAGPYQKPEQLELRILRALRRIVQAIDVHSRKLAQQHDITSPQLVTLLCVAEEGPLTLSGIAERVHVSSGTVVGILHRLESKGLVRRDRDTQDRRLVYVTITALGRRLAETAPSPLQDTFAEALHRLPELEQIAIAMSLERVVDLMQARGLDAAPLLETGELGLASEGADYPDG